MESEEERQNYSLLREQKWRLREEMLRRSRLIRLRRNCIKRPVQITKNECLSVGAKEENILEVWEWVSGKEESLNMSRSLPMLAMKRCLQWLWRRQWRSSEDWMCWWVKRKWREIEEFEGSGRKGWIDRWTMLESAWWTPMRRDSTSKLPFHSLIRWWKSTWEREWSLTSYAKN